MIKMKVGDLVRLYLTWEYDPQEETRYLGLITKIEKDFYRHNDYFQDCLTIYWSHNEITREPDGYVEVIPC